jgi:hypothetical protein
MPSGELLRPRSELTRARTILVSIGGLAVGILVLLSPYYFALKPLWISILSVLGSFILTSCVITPIQAYFLWRYQLEQTRAVLETSLTNFQGAISSSILSYFKWIRNIEEYGIKHVYHQVPENIIKEAINTSKNAYIRFLVLSYGLMKELYSEEFREALSNGCKVEVLTAEPNKNCLVRYYEETASYKDKRERYWAELCVNGLQKIKEDLPSECKGSFDYHTYTSATSIVALEIGPPEKVPARVWFGILWSHSQSYQGPWFEIRGDSRLAAYIHSHINEIKRREPSEEMSGASRPPTVSATGYNRL